MRHSTFFCLPLLLLLSPLLRGQEVVVLEKGFESHQLSQEVRVWVKPDSTADVWEALRRDASGDFQEPPTHGLVFPYRKCSYWLTFQIENQSETENLFLEISNLWLSDIQLFEKRGDTVFLSGRTGYALPEKPANDAVFFNLPFSIKAGETKRLYLFINTGRTGTAVILPLRVATLAYFWRTNNQKRWLEGVLTGGMIFALIFAVGLHGSLRSRLSFWLLCYFVSISLFLWASNGLLHRYCWSFFTVYTRLYIGILGNVSQGCIMILFYYFNDLKTLAPRFGLVLKALVSISLFCFFLQILGYFFETGFSDTFLRSLQATYAIPPVFIFLTSGWMIFRHRQARFFVFPVAFTFQGIASFWLIGVLAGYQNGGVFYREIILNIAVLFDFFVFLAWFSRELLLLKTDHTRQQLVLAQTRAEAAENLLRGQQEERRRLRLRLHDGLSILLASARMRLSKHAADDESLLSIERDIAAAATETRHLSHDLDPEPLREGHLLHALADSVGRAQGLSDAAVNFTFDENLDEGKLPQRLKVAVFYVAQELLHNALKHAEATEISLYLNFPDEKTLLLRCSDNGKGLDSMDAGSGIGLENIRARVATVNGLFSMQERMGGGLISEVAVMI